MSDNSSSSTAIVAIIAVLVIIALGFIVIRLVPQATDDGGGSTIDVHLNDGGGAISGNE